MPAYVKVSEDGRYGLVAPGPRDFGYHQLVLIATPELIAEGFQDEPLGAVSDPENFYTAIDAAEEKMRVLVAQAREEFGF